MALFIFFIIILKIKIYPSKSIIKPNPKTLLGPLLVICYTNSSPVLGNLVGFHNSDTQYSSNLSLLITQ
ncbi:hypothetical protein Pint_00435 [Pistacia integerrima]|uniref:Uncharacterized protein n=1 Tax=Pistacia integerrima TaxID=434235 RepID=A0ACC0ZGW6_9ROSI|nr:hypothetical protein Pint_00435 [Pistacia integerrima]